MSSQEDEHSDQELAIVPGMKKRRVQRACDICRRKKGACSALAVCLRSLLIQGDRDNSAL